MLNYCLKWAHINNAPHHFKVEGSYEDRLWQFLTFNSHLFWDNKCSMFSVHYQLHLLKWNTTMDWCIVHMMLWCLVMVTCVIDCMKYIENTLEHITGNRFTSTGGIMSWLNHSDWCLNSAWICVRNTFLYWDLVSYRSTANSQQSIYSHGLRILN